MTRPRIARRVRWRHLDRPGEESASLLSTASGWRLAGTARIDHPEGPSLVRYRVDLDRAWNTRAARIDLRLADTRRSLVTLVDEQGRWLRSGIEQLDLRGCVDVDLAMTPATNTIPIRRMDLPVGASGETMVGWMTFPDLELHRVRQRYTRLEANRYRYEAPHNGFVAEFEVDDVGLVLTYPGFWERASAARRPPRPRA